MRDFVYYRPSSLDEARELALGEGALLLAGGQTLLRRPLRSIYGVVLASNRDSAVYDPRGLGYGVTNLTVVVRRGRLVDTLTMSRLGRVRW